MSVTDDTASETASTTRRRFVGSVGTSVAVASGVGTAGALSAVGTADAAACSANLPQSDKRAGPVRVSTQNFYGGGKGIRLTVVNRGLWQPRVRVQVKCFARCGRTSAGLMRWRLLDTVEKVRSVGRGQHDVFLDTPAGTDAVRIFLSRNWF